MVNVPGPSWNGVNAFNFEPQREDDFGASGTPVLGWGNARVAVTPSALVDNLPPQAVYDSASIRGTEGQLRAGGGRLYRIADGNPPLAGRSESQAAQPAAPDEQELNKRLTEMYKATLSGDAQAVKGLFAFAFESSKLPQDTRIDIGARLARLAAQALTSNTEGQEAQNAARSFAWAAVTTAAGPQASDFDLGQMLMKLDISQRGLLLQILASGRDNLSQAMYTKVLEVIKHQTIEMPSAPH
jgi:hypothetical protein